MCKRQGILLILLCVSCALLTLGVPSVVMSQDKATATEKFTFTDIKADLRGEDLSLKLIGTTEPAYTVSERFSPFRVVVDVADANFADNVAKDSSMLPENKFVSVKVSEVALDTTNISRFEFTLADSHSYKVNRSGSTLDIIFSPNIASKTQSIKITDINVASTPNSTTIDFKATGTISDFTVDTLGASGDTPPRMYIDVKNVDVSQLVATTKVGTSSVSAIRVASKDQGGRIVFNSATNQLFEYSVEPNKNGLRVIVSENSEASTQKATPASSDATLNQLLASSEKIAVNPNTVTGEDTQPSAPTALDKLNNAFLGYDKEKISVDFYKIDLHNVFRLFREVSGLNILVDEAVSGTVTIAMNDVPWDFALDVILNLKNLAKTERHNTIVIYPKDKGFVWPSDTNNNLTIEADTQIITQEELIIEESANQPQEILLAKETLAKAKNFEMKGLFDKAAEAYYEAHELWPENPKILDRLTTVYLVNLQMSAKALHFAKKSLEIEPNNAEAALYAAISSANMGRTGDAAEFFRHSISGSPPAKEALMSFAAFSENNGNNDAALKLLKKLHDNYGESIESMVAVARVLDKKGEYEKANKQYVAILTSGFQLHPALRSYITERLGTE